MKLSKGLLKALNDQVFKEYEAAHLYKAMELYFVERGIKGFAHWLHLQVEEELEHAQDFINFIVESGEHVVFQDVKIDKKDADFKSIVDVFEKGLKHEESITKSIEDILELAIKEKHYAAENFLRTYIDEQMEEEDSFNNVLGLVKYCEDDKAALFEADKIMARRE